MKVWLSRIERILPRRLHRLALRYGFRFRVWWRRVDDRPSEGCALIVQNEVGHVLLVRHSYCEPETWMLPAGRMSRKESPLAAASRELLEEVACVLKEARVIEFEDTPYWGIRDNTFIIGGMADLLPKADLREIEEAAFFPVDELPPTASKPTLARLERWQLRNSLPFHAPAFVRLEYLATRYHVSRGGENVRTN